MAVEEILSRYYAGRAIRSGTFERIWEEVERALILPRGSLRPDDAVAGLFENFWWDPGIDEREELDLMVLRRCRSSATPRTAGPLATIGEIVEFLYACDVKEAAQGA